MEVMCSRETTRTETASCLPFNITIGMDIPAYVYSLDPACVYILHSIVNTRKKVIALGMKIEVIGSNDSFKVVYESQLRKETDKAPGVYP